MLLSDAFFHWSDPHFGIGIFHRSTPLKASRAVSTHFSGIESVVTHYEALLACPEQELRRLTDWLGWPVTDEAIAEACASVKPELRHHRQGLERLQGVGGPEGPASLYDKRCQRAGPNYSELHTADSREAVLTTPPSFSNPTWTEIPRRGIFPVS